MVIDLDQDDDAHLYIDGISIVKVYYYNNVVQAIAHLTVGSKSDFVNLIHSKHGMSLSSISFRLEVPITSM